MLKKIIVFLSLISSVLLLSSDALAQDISLSLSPGLSEVVTQPGRTLDLKFHLINQADPVIAKFFLIPFTPQGNLGNISLDSSLSNPLRFTTSDSEIVLDQPVFLESSESKQFHLQFSVPDGITLKDFYYSLIVESQPLPAQDGSINLRAKVRIVSNILITVTSSGAVDIKPKISLFDAVSENKLNLMGLKFNLFGSYQKIPLRLVVANTGENLIKSHGTLRIRGPLWFKKNIVLEPQTILSQSQRQLDLALPGVFAGFYRLSANLTFGTGAPTLYSTVTFLVFPFKFTVLFSFLFALTLLIMLSKRKKANKH